MANPSWAEAHSGLRAYEPPPAPSVVAAKMMDEQMSALLARALPYVQRAGAIELAAKIKFALGLQC
jgi:hypothetical protein